MDILTLDRCDEVVVERLWQLDQRSEVASRVRPRRVSLAEYAADLRFTAPGEYEEAFVARLDGQVAGGARVWFPQRDNADKCWWTVFVDPPARGQGVGGALLERLEQAARSQQRAMALPEVFVPVGQRATHPDVRFAARRGYRVCDTEIVRHLSLPLDPARVAALEQRAARGMRDAYAVAVYQGAVPEALWPGLCEVSNQLIADAPSGGIDFEAESMTPADYEQLIEHDRQVGRARLTAVGLHRASGEVVAYSTLALPAGDPTVAVQWGTLVRRQHRGHCLGLAVKVANLRQLARVDPGRAFVETMNAEDNPWMVQINVDLGFEIVEEALMLRKDL